MNKFISGEVVRYSGKLYIVQEHEESLILIDTMYSNCKTYVDNKKLATVQIVASNVYELFTKKIRKLFDDR